LCVIIANTDVWLTYSNNTPLLQYVGVSASCSLWH